MIRYKKRDDFSEDFCKYIQWRGDRGDVISLRSIGSHLEQAGWVADIMISLTWVLIKKKMLSQKDLKEIFWHGAEE